MWQNDLIIKPMHNTRMPLLNLCWLQFACESKLRLFSSIKYWKINCVFLTVNWTVSLKLLCFEFGKFWMFERQMDKPLQTRQGNKVSIYFSFRGQGIKHKLNETNTYILDKCYHYIKTLIETTYIGFI